MSGNSIGRSFVLTSFGESHGEALGGVVDGCPPGLELSEQVLQEDLDRRKPGQSHFTSQRREGDQVKILSGVFADKTTGTPIAFIIPNSDQRTKDYEVIKNIYRPAHADYVYDQKYGFRDYRGGGRASARETAVRVAAGAIAKKCLKDSYGVHVRGYLSQIGDIVLRFEDWQAVSANPFFAPNLSQVAELEELIKSLRRAGNSIGAEVTVVATGAMAGWGEPVYDRVDADLAKALMSINAVKAVAIGDGFDVVRQKGTEHRDEMHAQGFYSNHAGGVLGGICTGQPIVARIALKPTSSLTIPGRSIDRVGNPVRVVTKGRHDPCVGIRATPIAEAMVALVLADHALRHRGQCADVTHDSVTIPAQ